MARRRDGGEEGAAAVEMAIVTLSIFPVLLAFILPLTYLYTQRLALERNVGQTARWGSLVTNGSRAGVADVVRGRATAAEIQTFGQGSCGIPDASTPVACAYANDVPTISCSSSSSTNGVKGITCGPATPFSDSCASLVSITVTQSHRTDYGPTGYLLGIVGLANPTVTLTATSTVCKE